MNLVKKIHNCGYDTFNNDFVQYSSYDNCRSIASVANNLWYLDNKPVYYKWKHATVFDISDLPEFCMNSYCPLYRDLDENGQKYYYINEDAYDDYLREKEGKKSKIDEIIDDAMKFIDDECQILNEKEKF